MLEQSIDRLSGLIEQLITQLELGRQGRVAEPEVKVEKPGKPAPTPTAKASPSSATATSTESPSEGKPSSGDTKSAGTSTAPADTGASTGIDYMADVAPRFQLLVQKNRPAAVALIEQLKPGSKKLTEAVPGHDLADVLAQINALIGD